MEDENIGMHNPGDELYTNHGLIEIGRRPRDFVGADLPFEVRLASGNWQPYLPMGELQREMEGNPIVDTMACVSFSLTNAIETQEKFLTGQEVNYSDRWLAMMSGTTHNGNSLQIVADTVRKYGLVLESSWPKPKPNYTWDEYYAVPNPTEMVALKAEGQAWLQTHSLDYAWLGIDQATILKHLQHCPLQVVRPGHAIECYALYKPQDVVNFFDSYEPYEKTMPRSGLSDVLKPLLTVKNMTNTLFVHKTGTNEYAFYVPATTPEALKDKALNFGLDLTKADGSIDFTKAKEIIIN